MHSRASSARALVALLALALAGTGTAEQALVVVEGDVEQYREAAYAVTQQLSNSVRVEPNSRYLQAMMAKAPVVVAVGQRSMLAATSHANAVPIVFCMVLGISESMLSDSVTGVPLESDPALALAQIRSILPGKSRVGFVYDPTSSALLLARAKRAAAELNLSLVLGPVNAPTEVQRAVTELAPKADVLWLAPDPKLFSREVLQALLALSVEWRLPTVGFFNGFTQAGALASISPDYVEIGRRAGRLAQEIASRPSSQRLPVPPVEFAPGRLTINLKTAKALGFEVPSNAKNSAAYVYK